MKKKATIAIIDDETDVLDSLKWLMESIHYSVECYTNGETFLKSTSFDELDCLIVDVRMPDMSGLELQEALLQKEVDIPIIFITGHGDVPMAVRAMKSGAVDFLTKPVNNQVLLDTINKAMKINSKRGHLKDKQKKVMERIEILTPRELEIIKLIAKGFLTKSIAQELKISPNTVEIHRANIMRKMQAKNLAELFSMLSLTHLISENENQTP